MEADTRVVKLSTDELESVFARAAVTPLGQALVRAIREGDPVSAPYSSRELANTTGQYPCQLMSVTMQFASVMPGLFLLIELDNHARHPELLEVFNRPHAMTVSVRNQDGRPSTRVRHEFMALCIERRSIYFLDCRRERDILKSAVKDTSMYRRANDGKWHSPAIAEALEPFGIGYRLWVDSDFGPHYLGNISYLSAQFRMNREPPAKQALIKIIETVEARMVVYRTELVFQGIDANDIAYAIAHRLVYFPLDEEDLTHVEMARLYLDRSAYLNHKEQRRADGAGPPLSTALVLPRAGQEVKWHGVPWKVVVAGDCYVLTNSNGTFHDIKLADVQRFCEEGAWAYDAVFEPTFYSISPKRRQEAGEIVGLLARPDSEWIWPYGARAGKPMSPSTIARKRALVRKAQAAGTSVQLGLATGYDNCGDHSAKCEEGEQKIWRESLAEDYKKNFRPRFNHAYAQYCIRCKAAGIVPTSETTARRRLAKEEQSVIVESREGKFVAYQRSGYRPIDKSNRLVKGRVPWEVAHVDHARIEVALRSPITGELIDKPCWRTVLRDAKTFRVIGLCVFFGSPSYVVLYRLLLDTVRRFGRLPQYIVSDRGLEFLSKQWETTLAEYGTTKLNRPAKMPRAGQVAESGNRKDDESIVANLPGNRLNLEDFRSIAPGFLPKDNATLSLGIVRNLFEKVYFEIEPKHPTSRTNGEVLENFERRLLKEVGDSHIVKVPYSNNFRIICMPAVRGNGGVRIVTARGSVEALTLEFFSSGLLQPGVLGTPATVHFDPDNAGRVFAWVPALRMWVECHSHCYEVLSQYTAAEVIEYTAYIMRSGEVSKILRRRSMAEDLAKALMKARDDGDKMLAKIQLAASENAEGLEVMELGNSVGPSDAPYNPDEIDVKKSSTFDETDVEDIESYD